MVAGARSSVDESRSHSDGGEDETVVEPDQGNGEIPILYYERKTRTDLTVVSSFTYHFPITPWSGSESRCVTDIYPGA
jgi:hypothetical protein